MNQSPSPNHLMKTSILRHAASALILVASGLWLTSFAAEQTNIGQADQATLGKHAQEAAGGQSRRASRPHVEITIPAHLTGVTALELALGPIDNASGMATMLVVETNL
jgi:hypothetical protein